MPDPMTDAPAPKTPTKAEAKTKPEPKAPEIRNLTAAPFFYDDGGTASELDDKGILAGKNRKALTPAQWARRTPTQWGVLVANGHVEVANCPESDVEAFEAAIAAEEKRLSKAKGLSATERSMFGGQPKV